MFYGCTSLTQAPELPAMTLASNCYDSMFQGCTSLIQVPELSATTLTEGCYQNMFYGCTSLTQAPELSATTLANYCYNGMFSGCSNIPEPKYNISHMTFDQVTSAMQNNYILGAYGTCEVQCSDKILVAIFDEDNYAWTITEK
jgi:hypothetical protein